MASGVYRKEREGGEVENSTLTDISIYVHGSICQQCSQLCVWSAEQTIMEFDTGNAKYICRCLLSCVLSRAKMDRTYRLKLLVRLSTKTNFFATTWAHSFAINKYICFSQQNLKNNALKSNQIITRDFNLFIITNRAIKQPLKNKIIYNVNICTLVKSSINLFFGISNSICSGSKARNLIRHQPQAEGQSIRPNY